MCRALLLIASLTLVAGCGGGEIDAGPDGDGDADSDADSDGDGDGDGDVDSDSDGDGDIDADADGDIDADGDVDADGDIDADAEEDADSTELGYGAIESFVYERVGQQYLHQGLFGAAGDEAWIRDCAIDPEAGTDWDSCTPFVSIDASALRGVGGERYGAAGSFVARRGGAQVLQQSVITAEGSEAWGRECPVDDTTGVDWEGCGEWTSVDLSAIRGEGDERYGAFATYDLEVGEQRLLFQALYDDAGRRAWWRQCEIDPELGTVGESCTGWEYVDASAIRGIGGEAYGASTGYVYRVGGVDRLVQSLVDEAGLDSWWRECEVDPSVGVDWDGCTAWNYVDLRDVL